MRRDQGQCTSTSIRWHQSVGHAVNVMVDTGTGREAESAVLDRLAGPARGARVMIMTTRRPEAGEQVHSPMRLGMLDHRKIHLPCGKDGP